MFIIFYIPFQDITEEEKRTECEKKQAQILQYVTENHAIFSAFANTSNIAAIQQCFDI